MPNHQLKEVVMKLFDAGYYEDYKETLRRWFLAYVESGNYKGFPAKDASILSSLIEFFNEIDMELFDQQ